jgi:branched-chain amino acid transport system substrate-binding protein
MKTARRTAALAIAALLLAALPTRAAEEPFEIYAMVSLTGPVAFAGRGIANMLAAGERYVNSRAGGNGINGRPVHFVIQDDQSNPATAVQLANQIFAKRVAGIIGPAFGATCTAVLPIVNTNGPLSYCLSNTVHPTNGSYMFSANPSTKDFTAAIFRYAKAKGIKKLALLTSTDSSGQDGEAVALENLKTPEFRSLELVATEHFGVADLTVNAQMARIKASGAEAIDAWTTGTPFGTVLRSVSETGWDGILMTNAGNISKSQMDQYAQFIPRQLVFSGPPFMAIGIVPSRLRVTRATFLDAMHQADIGTVDQIMTLGWDPMLIVIDAFRHVGTNATAAQLRDYILKLHDFAGVNGIYDFRRGDQRGLDPSSGVVVRWDKGSGEFVTIAKPGGAPF